MKEITVRLLEYKTSLGCYVRERVIVTPDIFQVHTEIILSAE